MRMLNVLPFPLLILATALHVGDDRVERNRIVAGGFEIERRAEFEAVMLVVTTVVVIVVTLLLRGIRDKEEHQDPYRDV